MVMLSDYTVSDLYEFIEKVKEVYESFGVGAAIGLPFLETLFPFLPLFLMIAFNILSYNLFWGFMYTYIGTLFGTIVIFLFMRYVITDKFKKRLLSKSRFRKVYYWIEKTHPLLHIAVLMIPFSPTFMINYSMGLTRMKFKTFLLITTISRGILLVICIPFGMTLVSLYNSNSVGGVEVMWLSVTGLVILSSIIVGQILDKKIKNTKMNGNSQKNHT